MTTAAVGFYSTGVVLADLNRDGLLDLITSNGNDMGVQVLAVHLNTGNTEFFSTWPDWYSAKSDFHGALSVGDVNADGWLDVVVAVPTAHDRQLDSGGIELYLNHQGTLATQPSWHTPGLGSAGRGFYALAAKLADMDADGDLDLVVPVFAQQSGSWPLPTVAPQNVRIFVNQGGEFGSVPAWTSSPTKLAAAVHAADINQDGWMDLAVAAERTAVFFGHKPDGASVPLSQVPDWASADVQGFSGAIDAARVGTGAGLTLAVPSGCVPGDRSCTSTFKLYRPSPGGHTGPTWQSGRADSSAWVKLADLNQDGNVDLVADQWGPNDGDGGPMWLFQGTADGLASRPALITDSLRVGQALSLGDLKPHIRKSLRERRLQVRVDKESAVFSLPERLPYEVKRALVNGIEVPYAWVPGENTISLSGAVPAGAVVELLYDYSAVVDIVEGVWNPQFGNEIYLSFLVSK